MLPWKMTSGFGRTSKRLTGLMLPPQLTGTGLLLIFLAWVMCVCGTLGYQHLTTSGPAAPLEMHKSAQADSNEERPGDHGPAIVLYTVSLFVAYVGAALCWLLARARRPRPAAIHRLVRRPLPRTTPVLAQAPARAQLQVFLL